jgi:hypothetical protein
MLTILVGFYSRLGDLQVRLVQASGRLAAALTAGPAWASARPVGVRTAAAMFAAQVATSSWPCR